MQLLGFVIFLKHEHIFFKVGYRKFAVTKEKDESMVSKY